MGKKVVNFEKIDEAVKKISKNLEKDSSHEETIQEILLVIQAISIKIRDLERDIRSK